MSRGCNDARTSLSFSSPTPLSKANNKVTRMSITPCRNMRCKTLNWLPAEPGMQAHTRQSLGQL